MFLTVMTVAEALGALAPARRSAIVAVAPALGVVPARRRRVAASGCPAGRARRSTATPSARPTPTRRPRPCRRSWSSPARSRWAAPPTARSARARRWRSRPAGCSRAGADAVVMVEYTTEPMPGHVELLRGVAPGDGVLQPGEEAAPGDAARAGGPPAARCRPRAAGLGRRHGDRRARTARAWASSRPATRSCRRAPRTPAPGQVRDACAPALAGHVREAGGEPVLRGIVPDDAAELERVLGEARRRGRRRRRVGRLLGRRPRPHRERRRAARRGRLPRAGDQARQADAAGRLRRRAADRAAGQSALGARRLPARRHPARAHGRGDHGAAAGRDRARDARARRPQRRRTARHRPGDGRATASRRRASAPPRCSARWWEPTASSACPRPPPGSARAPRSTSSSTADAAVRAAPFLSDIPAAEALATWLAAVPDRLEAVELELADALGRVTAAPIWALRSSPAYDAAAMDGIAVRAADTFGATETAPRKITGRSPSSTPATRCPRAATRSIMREQLHWEDGVPEVRAAAAPWQHVRTIGEDLSATELLLPEGHRLRPVDLAAAAAAGHTTLTVRRAPHVIVIPTGDEVRPLGSDPAPGELRRHQLADARRARRARPAAPSSRSPCSRTTPRGSAPRVAEAAARADLVIVIAGSSAGRDDHTADVVAEDRHAARARRRGQARPSRRARHRRRDRGARRARLSGLRRADVRDLRDPAARRARGRGAGRAAPRARAARAPAGLLARLRRLDPRPPRPRRRRARRRAAAPRRRRPHLARARRRPARRARRARRPRRRRRRSRCGCCATSTRSSARSSRSARTTRCSTSPPRCCAPATRCRRSSAAPSARSAAWSRCATASATSPAATCSTRTAASTRCRGSSACCPDARSRSSGSSIASRG